MKKFNKNYKKNDFMEEIESPVIPSLSPPEVKNTLVPPSGAAIIQRYLWEVNQYSLLTPEEEFRLAHLYKEKKDKEAAFKLITSNLRLVVKIALEFQSFWASNFMDLIQEGNIGLMMGLKKYDPDKGIRFPYYASFWIKAYILKFILDNWRLVKVGTTQAQRKLFYNLQKEKQNLIRLGYEPIPQLIAKKLNVREKDVIEMEQRMGGGEFSLDAPLNPETKDSFKEVIPLSERSPEEIWARNEIKELVAEKIESIKKELSPKEKDILELRLLADKPLTLKEIGKRHHVSRERIRQIEARLLRKLGDYLKKEFPDYKEALTIKF